MGIYTIDELEKIERKEQEIKPLEKWLRENKNYPDKQTLAENKKRLLTKLKEYNELLNGSYLKTN